MANELVGAVMDAGRAVDYSNPSLAMLANANREPTPEEIAAKEAEQKKYEAWMEFKQSITIAYRLTEGVFGYYGATLTKMLDACVESIQESHAKLNQPPEAKKV